MENFSAILLNGHLSFGKYPTQNEADIISQNDYTHIINLCTDDEITWSPPSFNKNIKIIHYPFEDGNKQYPSNGWPSFEPFIKKIIKLLNNNNNKLYIHCKGGHGRSATITAILYARLTGCSSVIALDTVHKAHQNRLFIKHKWRLLGAPQRLKQKLIVNKFS